MGVGDIVMKNSTLLFKWWWRFSFEKNSLWKQVVCSCNNLEADRLVNEINPTSGSGPWFDTYKIGINNPELRSLVLNGI